MKRALRVLAVAAAAALLAGCDISGLLRLPGAIEGTVVLPSPAGSDQTVWVWIGDLQGGGWNLVAWTATTVRAGSQQQMFVMPDVPPGTWKVRAAADLNMDRQLEAGELYGEVDGVQVRGGPATRGVVVLLQQYSGQAFPMPRP